MPDFELEQSHDGLACGLDEVGRGPCAGPVVAACVHISVDNYSNPLWQKVNDSKLITKKTLPTLAEAIKSECKWAIAESSVEETDQINVVQASFLAMNRAYSEMGQQTTLALIDGNLTPKSFPCTTKTVIKGDTKSASIAAASIIAKVYRDNLMAKLAEHHPHYGWETNAGYPTKQHLEGIETHGITIHHRKSFAPIKNFLQFGTTKRQLEIAL
ncbi:ribonuclease HII [Alphaproteobacteria bacterium]|nr:ribonuclease HII [Alphaproteobacteria bacterium]